MREFALTRLSWRGQHPGHRGGPGDAVRLGRDQAAERRGEQRHRVAGLYGVREDPAQERAQRHGRPDRPPPAVAEAVQERADQRGDDRERQHRQAQEQRDLPAGLVGRDLEEQGAGQRDRHRRVAGAVEGVQLDQPGQAAVAGPLGVRGAAGLAQGVAGGSPGAGPGPAGPAGGGLRGAAPAPDHGPSAPVRSRRRCRRRACCPRAACPHLACRHGVVTVDAPRRHRGAR